MNKIDRYLAILFGSVLVFTITMIAIFCTFQSIPDTLVGSVFGLAFGECGVLGLIKNAKEKHGNRNEDEGSEPKG